MLSTFISIDVRFFLSVDFITKTSQFERPRPRPISQKVAMESWSCEITLSFHGPTEISCSPIMYLVFTLLTFKDDLYNVKKGSPVKVVLQT